MTKNLRGKHTMTAMIAALIFSLAIPVIAVPLGKSHQRRSGGGGGQRQAAPPRQSAPQRQAPPPRQEAPVQQVHARREGVRTQNFVTRTQTGNYQPAAPVRQAVPSRPAGPAFKGTSRPSPSQLRTRQQSGPVAGRVAADRNIFLPDGKVSLPGAQTPKFSKTVGGM